MPLGLAEAERVTETEKEGGRVEGVTDGVEVIAEVIVGVSEDVREGVALIVPVTEGIALALPVTEVV